MASLFFDDYFIHCMKRETNIYTIACIRVINFAIGTFSK